MYSVSPALLKIMATSRMIKEEMLQAIAPEIYGVKKEIKPKIEIKGKVEGRPTRRARKRRAPSANSSDDNDLEILGVLNKRRPYQWRGRRVKKVLRPGTTVVFTPGMRTNIRGFKRSADEIFGDEDILSQAENREGEFAYGKRSRMEPFTTPNLMPVAVRREPQVMILDQSNPTPSLRPVTEQTVLPIRKRKIDDANIQPTVEILAPKRQAIKAEPIDTSQPMVVEDIKVRAPKRISSSLSVQTVDIKVPMNSISTQTETEEPMEIQPVTVKKEFEDIKPIVRRPKNLPRYAYHPSIKATPGYNSYYIAKSTRKARRRRTRRRRTRSRRSTRVNNIIPGVRYHPSISMPPTTMFVR